MATQCKIDTNKFRIQSNGTNEITAKADTIDACTAATLLDRLHLDFTKLGEIEQEKPTYWLRIKSEPNSNSSRFYDIFTTQTSKDQTYRTAVHAIMNGVNDPNITEADYLNKPSTQTDLSTPANFKGINGLVNLNNVLEKLITEKVRTTTGSSSVNITNSAQHYSKRQEIKTTLEEIARRENEIYREKFLNIILVIIGVVFIGTLLSKKFYSGGGGGGGGGSGLFGNMFTGVGLGSSSGIFSRFGGLGLGRSGRSRVSGLFSNNPYSLSKR